MARRQKGRPIDRGDYYGSVLSPRARNSFTREFLDSIEVVIQALREIPSSHFILTGSACVRSVHILLFHTA